MIDFTSAQVLAFVRTSIQHWIDNDMEAFSAGLREDAVVSSPFVRERSATTWVRGRQEISRHLHDARSRYKALAITDIATDAALYYTLLLSDGQDHLTILMEPEGPPLLIRRMIICKSVFHAD